MHSLCGGPALLLLDCGLRSVLRGTLVLLRSGSGCRSKSVPKIVLPSCSSSTGVAVIFEFMLLDPACEPNKDFIVLVDALERVRKCRSAKTGASFR